MRITKALLASMALTILVLGMVIDPSGAGEARADATPANYATALALNVPGSVLTGASQATDSYTAGQVAALLANKTSYDWTWSSDSAMAAVSGNATTSPATTGLSSADQATFNALEAEFAAPATKVAGLAKVVSGVNVPIFAAQAGFALGSGADRMLGVDVTGSLCSPGPSPLYTGFNAVLSGLTFSNCGQWQTSSTFQQQANSGLPPTQIVNPSLPSCGPRGCAAIYSSFWDTSVGLIYCVAVTSGNLFDAPQGAYTHNDDGSWWWLGGDAYKTTTISPCPRRAGSTYYSILQSNLNGGTAASAAQVWRAAGDSSEIAGTPVDPTSVQRTFRCVVKLASGGTVSGTSIAFNEADSDIASPSCPALSAAQVPTQTTLTETSPWGDEAVTSGNVSSQYKGWKTAYPECSNGSCLLDLRINGSSCFTAPSSCSSWFTASNRASVYSCYYGTHVLSLSECYVYRNAFNQTKVGSGFGFSIPSSGADPGTQTSQTGQDRVREECVLQLMHALPGSTQTLSQSIGVSADKCADGGIPIYSPGADLGTATAHRIDAIRKDPLRTFLHYEDSTIKTNELVALGAGTVNTVRRWYVKTSECSDYSSPNSCDEFPNFTTVEGARVEDWAARPVVPQVSLEVLPLSDNSAEGNAYSNFLTACHRLSASASDPTASGSEFLEIPMSDQNTINVCNGN